MISVLGAVPVVLPVKEKAVKVTENVHE